MRTEFWWGRTEGKRALRRPRHKLKLAIELAMKVLTGGVEV